MLIYRARNVTSQKEVNPVNLLASLAEVTDDKTEECNDVLMTTLHE